MGGILGHDAWRRSNGGLWLPKAHGMTGEVVYGWCPCNAQSYPPHWFCGRCTHLPAGPMLVTIPSGADYKISPSGTPWPDDGDIEGDYLCENYHLSYDPTGQGNVAYYTLIEEITGSAVWNVRIQVLFACFAGCNPAPYPNSCMIVPPEEDPDCKYTNQWRVILSVYNRLNGHEYCRTRWMSTAYLSDWHKSCFEPHANASHEMTLTQCHHWTEPYYDYCSGTPPETVTVTDTDPGAYEPLPDPVFGEWEW